MQLTIQQSFAPFKRVLPKWLSGQIRSVVTAFLGPLRYAYKTGFVLSSFKTAAVTKTGSPLPWYTYPSIDFLKYRNFTNKRVLEFGGGQSTLWWSGKALRVVTFEGDEEWYLKIRSSMPDNVELHHVSMKDRETNVREVNEMLAAKPDLRYDVIVIDGLYREEMIDIACRFLSRDGFIVCDNAEGFGICNGFIGRGLCRVDFYGLAPGVVDPHCTSIYFRSSSFVFDPATPIHVIARE